jgi:GxxExxY protein
MNANDRELVLRDEVYQVVGSAFEVLGALGPGLLEKPYERALAVEFGLRGIPYDHQRPFEVSYKGTIVGNYIPDLTAYAKIIIEVKSIDQITRVERAQLLNYLRIASMPVGVILNFKRPKLEWERMALSL